MMADRLRALYRRHFIATHWNIGSAPLSLTDLEKLVARGELGRVCWWPDVSPFSFRADPFFWSLEGDPRIIYEEMDHLKRRAHIRSRSLSGPTGLGRSRAEIVQPYHLSYPFVFQVDGVWRCMPESARASGLDLYAWHPEENSWKLERRLLGDLAILDATLFKHQELWYLFGTVRGEGAYDRLRIWCAAALDAPWRAHRLNPAKTNIASARPAGPLFSFKGQWYRPAQDCTQGYGTAVAINRIDVLTPDDFSETTVSRVHADPQGPYPDGLHTLIVADGRLIIDGKRIGFTPSLPWVKAVRKIGGWLRSG